LGSGWPIGPGRYTIWAFREAPTRATLNAGPANRSGIPGVGRSYQIVDGPIIAAPKQRNTDAEKRELLEGRIPAAGRRRWSKAQPVEDGAPRIDLAAAPFGHKTRPGDR
jgi:hypothetical protein